MPQNPVLVYAKDGGTPCYMHTVDAAEAVRLGDYTPVPPGDASPEAKASALSRFKTGQATTHPEMQTDEEKAEARAKANEEAELMAGVPPGAAVVVQAPSRAAPRPSAPSTAPSSAAAHTESASAASRRSGSTPPSAS